MEKVRKFNIQQKTNLLRELKEQKMNVEKWCIQVGLWRNEAVDSNK